MVSATRWLLGLLLTTAMATAVAPSAQAVCVDRDDGQQLACLNGPYRRGSGACVSAFVNPPMPDTVVGTYACTPNVVRVFRPGLLAPLCYVMWEPDSVFCA